MVRKYFALGLALSLAACNTPVTGPSSGATSTPVASASDPAKCGLAAGTLVDEKALYGAEAAYNVPANAYVTLDANGKLSAETKAKVKPLLIGAYDALKVARSAYSLGDVCSFTGAVNSVRNLTNSAKAILPHRE